MSKTNQETRKQAVKAHIATLLSYHLLEQTITVEELERIINEYKRDLFEAELVRNEELEIARNSVSEEIQLFDVIIKGK